MNTDQPFIAQPPTRVAAVIQLWSRTRQLREFEQLSGASHGNTMAFLRGGGASELEMGRIISQLTTTGETTVADELLLAHVEDHIPVGHEKRVRVSLANPAKVAEKSTPPTNPTMDRLRTWVCTELRHNPAMFDMLAAAYSIAQG